MDYKKYCLFFTRDDFTLDGTVILLDFFYMEQKM